MSEIFEERVHRRVGVNVDRRPTAAEVHHRGRGDSDLDDSVHGAGLVELSADKLIVGDLDRLGPLQLARHAQRGRLGIANRALEVARDADAADVLEEIEVELRGA